MWWIWKIKSGGEGIVRGIEFAGFASISPSRPRKTPIGVVSSLFFSTKSLDMMLYQTTGWDGHNKLPSDMVAKLNYLGKINSA